MEDIEVMIAALNAMKETLIQEKQYNVLNTSVQEIITANISELTDVMLRYCKENYDS